MCVSLNQCVRVYFCAHVTSPVIIPCVAQNNYLAYINIELQESQQILCSLVTHLEMPGSDSTPHLKHLKKFNRIRTV